jgi:signal peptidase I
VFAIGLLAYNHFFSQFYIPSESMRETLQINDRILVLNDQDNIQRGDIVVFQDPGGWLNNTDTKDGNFLVKRVIGVGGDTVECCDPLGRNIINGVPVDETYIKGSNLLSFTVKVPEGEIWVEGDNRENSGDSRYHQEINGGFVPLTNVQGKAVSLVWPFDHFQIF